jgi:ATP-dependent exoDNAse (exonuclease V) beta subunit
VRDYFLTQEGEPRKKNPFRKALFTSDSAWATHGALIVDHGAPVRDAALRYKRDLNVLVSRGILRMYQIAELEYRRTLDAHAVLDFSDLLRKALHLLGQMEEFSRSRYRLESRYHHVLVDEFQDTSRAQWELVSLLVQSWGEGAGLAWSGPIPPSIFIVGDRKQSIYGFRDADVSMLDDARRYIERLRPDGDVGRSISRSFRAVPALLAFVNDVSRDIQKVAGRRDAFRYDEEDLFPIDSTREAAEQHALGLITADTAEACAEETAEEIARLLETASTVRDKTTGVRRAITPADIAILFRTRDSHREFEDALERRGVASYVYKGLGFFDADEIKDVLALLWYLADPFSDLRAAALLRSRFVRLSDEALRRLAPGLAASLRMVDAPHVELCAADAAALALARESFARWRGLVDRLPPAELLDLILSESAYFIDLRGTRFRQARENLKKIRALIRRIQNRGYATLGRIAAHLDRLAVGDESNAAIDALEAVNLMTVHASKGLEFPVVFVVNLARGTGSFRDPIRVSAGTGDDEVSVAVGDFRSNADDDDAAKDREETKRLLYVALTRARDRLYLGSVLKEGRLQPGRGSLAEVLPQSLIEQFAVGADGRWRGSSGGEHWLRGITDPGSGIRDPKNTQNVRTSDPGSRIPDSAVDIAPLVDAARRRVSVGEVIATDPARVGHRAAPASDRLTGTLVHRLLQRVGFSADVSADSMRDLARRLLRRDELDDVVEIDRVVEAAIASHALICAHDDVRRLYSSGRRFHEVPFTMTLDGRLVRGTVDCVVETAPGSLTVLEFKTGRPRPEHQAQVEIYVHAMRQACPGTSIDARVIYGDARPAPV